MSNRTHGTPAQADDASVFNNAERMVGYIVRKGAALLDSVGPAGWRSRIDGPTLDMASTSGESVLGQIYGNHVQGMRVLWMDSKLGDAITPEQLADSCGFRPGWSGDMMIGAEIQFMITANVLRDAWLIELNPTR